MILRIISLLLMSLGCVMMFTAALGLLRFPDIYMRLHASGKAGTGGTLALLGGVLLRTGIDVISGKIILVMVFVLLTGPIISHALARAAHISSDLTADTPFHDLEEEISKKEGDKDDD
ncbi:MAG: monovalent cation/H(+) antiporter subunit G [Candidatus Thermoplasmatota archaeon]|nr:monovalent cation/H(+) antiporter subunit G [Candidatus Thermoplasmatota archaeon]